MEQKNPFIVIENKKCRICYACVRACPVKALQVKESGAIPHFVESRCIACGTCVTSCHPDAISYRSSLHKVRDILNSKEKKAAIISPSIAAEFEDISDYRKFVGMVRELGFDYIHEISFGVDLIAYKYQELFKDFKGRYYILANDPVIVSYITKYKPSLVKNLAPIVSPTIASAIYVREYHQEELKVVAIGPDIATKLEADQYPDRGRIDAVMTFPELRELFEEYNISEGTLEYSDFDPPLGYKGSLYPIANGFVQAGDFNENLLDSRIISVEGKKAVLKSLDEFEESTEMIGRHLNPTFGNSLMGPGNSPGKKLVKEALVIRYVSKRLQNFFRYEWHKSLTRYLRLDYSTEHHIDDQRLKMPTEDEINGVLRELNRCEGENVGCEDCGYNSCRDFAIAVAQGVTRHDLCSTYAIQSSKKLIGKLSQANQKLKETQEALQESESLARTEKEIATNAWELTNTMFQKLRAGVVIADTDLKIIQANNAFVNIVGEEAAEINEIIPGLVGADLKKILPDNLITLFSFVISTGNEIEDRDLKIGNNLLNVSFFPIRKDKIVGAILRDMNTPEVQKAEVINRINDVIDRNLEMVQKIGFFLGEGASDIEKELNSIIEFYKSGSKR